MTRWTPEHTAAFLRGELPPGTYFVSEPITLPVDGLPAEPEYVTPEPDRYTEREYDQFEAGPWWHNGGPS